MLVSKAYWKSAGLLDVRRLAASVALGLGAWSCSTPLRIGPQAAAIAAARVQSQTSPYRPLLALVEREGDPKRGLALAVHVAASPVAATALSMLVEGRMRGAGIPGAVARASPSGFILGALGDKPEDVARFIREGNRALVTPVAPVDAERVAAHWRSSPPRLASSPSEAAVARCSGELLLPAEAADAASHIVPELDAWLSRVGSADVAFAVVGAPEQLQAGAAALNAVPLWSRLGGASAPRLARDVTGSVSMPGGLSTLSIAEWGLPPAAAIASAERLAEPESLLAVRLSAGFPAWQVARVVSNLDRGGACLRIDLQAIGSVPTAEAVASSVTNVLDELDYTLARVRPGPWVLSKQVLAMESPDQGAAVAAWQALAIASPAVPASELRHLVHYSGELAAPTRPERFAELLANPAEPSASGPELRRGVEPGQGKFWLLLATPCGTGNEDATTAGTLALALQASALAFNGQSGVNLEPWLNVDAMGILAHSAAMTPHESPEAQAERVAEALGRALLSAGPAPEVIFEARDALLGALAQGPAPSLALALRQTSANHPSWLEARGTWSSLSAISGHGVQLERQAFIRGKLRLASLGNHDAVQIDAGEQRLLRLLRSADAGQGDCPARRAVAPIPGKYRIETTGSAEADAIISVPLPTDPRGLPEEALWTEVLMNRTDGWLERALLQPGLVSTARARALGGAGSAALVIEIHAVDGKREEAVAQVRGLLERLRDGAATAEDARNAQEYVAQTEARRQLNPRGRLVDLWHGSRREAATLESLHALHRAAFEAGREVVVLTEPSE